VESDVKENMEDIERDMMFALKLDGEEPRK